MADQIRRYVFKLYPTPDQAAALHEQRRMMADLWNALKQRCEDTYRTNGGQRGVCHRESKKSLNFFDLTNEITELRHACPEWEAVPAVSAHRVAKHLIDAYQAFYRRLKNGEAAGYPKWQARERSTTIPLGTMGKTGWTLRKRDDNPLSWALHYGGVSHHRDRSTWIHARGRIPAPKSVREGGEPMRWINADIIWRDNRWWLSAVVEMQPRRAAGASAVRVDLNLVDEFARVNRIPETPDGLYAAMALDEKIDRLKSERDSKFPRAHRRNDAEQAEFVELCGLISRLSAKAARIRSNALHVWSARVVRRADDLTIMAPLVRQHTGTPRGDEKHWGAAVSEVSEINRNTLQQAPASAVQMLRYKAAEAGIRCDVVTDEAPLIAVGSDLVTAGKQLRRARRVLRKEAA